jgi:L-asparagine transporter-like permease
MALDRMNIPGASLLMNFIVLTAVLSCLNSGVYVTSRVLFTLAAKRDAPQALVQLNRRKVPVRAILMGSAFGFLAVIISVISPSRVFAFLVNASGALMLMIYLLIALAQIRLRTRLERENPQRLTVKMWLFPWASWAVIAAILAVLIAMFFTEDLATQLYASLAVVAIVVAAAVAVRVFRKPAAAVLAPS